MTKKQAFKQLELDFLNRLIGNGYQSYNDIELEIDRELFKALKFKDYYLTQK
jgi:hypothetical protein